MIASCQITGNHDLIYYCIIRYFYIEIQLNSSFSRSSRNFFYFIILASYETSLGIYHASKVALMLDIRGGKCYGLSNVYMQKHIIKIKYPALMAISYYWLRLHKILPCYFTSTHDICSTSGALHSSTILWVVASCFKNQHCKLPVFTETVCQHCTWWSSSNYRRNGVVAGL